MADNISEKKATEVAVEVDDSLIEPLQNKLIQLLVDEDLDADEVRPVAQDENFVRRCLMVCFNDEKKAFKLGATALRWRSKVKPSKIQLQDFPTAWSQNTWRLGCHAKDGSAVAFGVAKNHNPWKYGTDEYIREIAHLVQACENALNPSDPSAKIYFFLDMKGMSFLNGDLRKIRQLAKITSEYYPSRCVGVALNADWVTMTLWKMLSPLLDKVTRDRVSIYRPGTFSDFLEEIVGLDQVPPSLGGTRADEYPPMTEEIVSRFAWRADGVSETPLKRHETDGTEEEVNEECVSLKVCN